MSINQYRGANIFAIIAEGNEQIRQLRGGRHLEKQMFEEVTQSSSYSKAIAIVQKYVNLAKANAGGARLPEGKYVLADPCVSLCQEEYSELLDLALNNGWIETKFVTLTTGRNVWVLNTAHGDGMYASSNGFNIGVDSGGIAVTTAREEDTENVIEMTSPFACHSIDGLLHFGHITVRTDDSACDECGMRYCECDDDFDDED